MTKKGFDYSPLSKQFPNREVWQYFMRTTFKPFMGDRSSKMVTIFIFIVFVLPVTVFVIISFFMTFMALANSSRSGINLIVMVPFSIIPLGLLASFLWFGRRNALRAMQFRLFAETNQMRQLTDGNEGHQGLIFHIGDSQRFNPGYELANKAQTSFGNFQWTTGSGRSRRTHNQGFLSIKLSRNLPHVVMDAASNNNNFLKVSNLPVTFKNSQHLSLEGDFDQHFTVYSPAGYGRDTLYWLTPELMAILIDKLGDYDIEVIDDRIYLYPLGVYVIDQPTVEKLVGLADWLYEEFEENTHRYSDERVASFTANVVGGQGQRLEKGVSKVAVIVVIVYMLLYALRILQRL